MSRTRPQKYPHDLPCCQRLVELAHEPEPARVAPMVGSLGMPMTYLIDGAARLIRIAGAGRVTDEDMARCIASLRADPRIEPDFCTLSDMRDIEVGFTSKGIDEMLAIMANTADRRTAARVAIVVSTDVAFGMGRMLEMSAEETADPKFQIFRGMEAALGWLGTT